MKKLYIKPTVTVVITEIESLLAGSGNVGYTTDDGYVDDDLIKEGKEYNGTTPAKGNNVSIWDAWDE